MEVNNKNALNTGASTGIAYDLPGLLGSVADSGLQFSENEEKADHFGTAGLAEKSLVPVISNGQSVQGTPTVGFAGVHEREPLVIDAGIGQMLERGLIVPEKKREKVYLNITSLKHPIALHLKNKIARDEGKGLDGSLTASQQLHMELAITLKSKALVLRARVIQINGLKNSKIKLLSPIPERSIANFYYKAFFENTRTALKGYGAPESARKGCKAILNVEQSAPSIATLGAQVATTNILPKAAFTYRAN